MRKLLLLSLSLASVGMVHAGDFTNRKADRQVAVASPITVDLSRFKGTFITSSSLQTRAPENPKPRLAKTDNRNVGVLGMMGDPSNKTITSATSSKFPGLDQTNYVPADATIAVGPSHIVETDNVEIGIYTKTGTQVLRVPLGGTASSFIKDCKNPFDPKVFFDHISGRFFLVVLDGFGTTTGSTVWVGVSKTSDPTGAWFFSKVNGVVTQGTATSWWDYPGFAVSSGLVMLTGNIFPDTTGGYAGGRIVALSKSALLNGTSSTALDFLIGPNDWTIQPARQTDATVENLFAMSTTAGSLSSIKAYALVPSGGGTSATLSSATIQVPSFPDASTSPYVQGPGVSRFDSFDGRAFTSQMRGGKLYTAHQVPTSTGATTSKVLWYQVDLKAWPVSGLPTLAQAGQVGGSGGYSAMMPAVGLNRLGDMSLFYNETGPDVTVDTYVASRKKSDKAGTLGKRTKLVSSPAATYRDFTGAPYSRWGDYWSAESDPVNPSVFYGVSMKAKTSGSWATDIVSWSVTSSDNQIITPATPNIEKGTLTSGTQSSLQADDGLTYNVFSAPQGGIGQVATVSGSFSVQSQAGFTLSGAIVDVSFNGPAEASGFVYLYNYTTAKYDIFRQLPLGKNQVLSISLPGELGTTFTSRYISSSGEVKVALRAVSPNKGTSSPAAFVFSIDRMTLTSSLSTN